jgi:hypothetical protein
VSNDYAPREIDGRMCVWLPEHGWHPAKPVGDVVPGDVIVYNYGDSAVVNWTRRTPSGASVILNVTSNSGREYECVARRATTLVAVKARPVEKHDPDVCRLCGESVGESILTAADTVYGPAGEPLACSLQTALEHTTAAFEDDDAAGLAAVLDVLGVDSLADLSLAYRHFGHFGECRKELEA